MGTLDEGIQLCLSRVWIFGEVGVDVVVVLDSIGRASLPLHRIGVVGANALGAVVGLRGVLQQTDLEQNSASSLRENKIKQKVERVF